MFLYIGMDDGLVEDEASELNQKGLKKSSLTRPGNT